ncbi:urate hydroxylase PuuD [Castellaniella sp. GW247-6E4]|uniref:urate hydroxylase PuuD n=1 Tax=Castellaniella sp. GW247-6E4 TaxID=3140380 RepID=UPI0033151092
MEAYIADWLHLGLRWLHVVAAITWVGSSFYFNRIDRSFRPPEPPVDRVSGQLWSIHGGSIYNYSRYPTGPGYVPENLKWSKWESVGTWVSGALLLAVVYWWGAGINLVTGPDGLSPAVAILVSAGSMVLAWVVYDIMCRTIPSDHVLSVAVAAFMGLLLWIFLQIFSGKAAFLHVGIAMATLMAGNVWFVILPGQKKMLRAIKDGTIDRFDVGADAKRRNYHSNYLTLPIVFAMIASHFPMTYGSAYAWLGFMLISAAGVAVRHFFNTMHHGHAQARWLVIAALISVAAIVLLAPPRLTPPANGQAAAVDTGRIASIIEARCAACHAAKPSMPGFNAPPNGLVLDSLQAAAAHAQKIRQMTIDAPIMPPGNLTGMSDEERAALAGWLAAGAPTK